MIVPMKGGRKLTKSMGPKPIVRRVPIGTILLQIVDRPEGSMPGETKSGSQATQRERFPRCYRAHKAEQKGGDGKIVYIAGPFVGGIFFFEVPAVGKKANGSER
jgi:hypothetical protein